MDKNLTLEQRYTAIYIFWGKQYFKTLSDDLGSILGNMSTCQNGNTMDPATWSEWVNLKNNSPKKSMPAKEAYQIMIAFMEYYISNGFDELKSLHKQAVLIFEGKCNRELWNEWLSAVKEAQEKGIEATRLQEFKNYDNYTDS